MKPPSHNASRAVGLGPGHGTRRSAPERPRTSLAAISARQPGQSNGARVASRDASAVLLERLPITGELLRLKLSRPDGFRYRPGQHLKMGVPGLMRDYSLVSAPHEDHLEFFIELFAQGQLSERLRRIGTGAAMALGRAKGGVALDERRPTQLMVATVTGIAPYVSLLRHHLCGGGQVGDATRRFIVLHGASYQNEFGYLAELAALALRHPGRVIYVPTVSRPDSPRNQGWGGECGRVENHLDPLIARYHLTPADTAVFACGNPAMVASVAGLFRKRGFAAQTESFD
jgi:ferredoxin/flavodoxin---NADP+ reductase